jgi:hypothetical protein
LVAFRDGRHEERERYCNNIWAYIGKLVEKCAPSPSADWSTCRISRTVKRIAGIASF